MRTYLGDNLISTMLIAVESDEILGSAAPPVSDMDNKSEFSPGLANVYVRSDKRSLGVWARLVEFKKAKALFN